MGPLAIMAYSIAETSFSGKMSCLPPPSSLPLPLPLPLYSPGQPVVRGRGSLESCVWPLHHNHRDHWLTDWEITERSRQGPGWVSASHYKVCQRRNLGGQKTCIQLNLDLESGRNLKVWWKYKYIKLIIQISIISRWAKFYFPQPSAV